MPTKSEQTFGNYYFVILGHYDNPVFEMEFTNNKELAKENHQYLNQFIADAVLDLIDEQKWKTHSMYLKSLNIFNQLLVSSFVTASLVRFVMVHDIENEDGINNFFTEMNEMYIKHCMNPFYEEDTSITSTAFEKKAHLLGQKYLTS